MNRVVVGTPREFAKVVRLPLLARALIGSPGVKPKGMRRLLRKISRALFTLIHVRMKIPAPGQMLLTSSDGQKTTVRINGVHSSYALHCGRQRCGGYEPAETILIDRILPKISVFYDIGANWGYFTWLAATNRAFSGDIYSFEVSPRMIEELKNFLVRTGFRNVTLLPFGLSDKSGPVHLTSERHTYLTRITNEVGGKIEKSEARRLDELQLPPPELIKMDVEDHELAVLHGARQMIARHRPGILFECRDPSSPVSTPLFEFLEENNYIIHTLSVHEGGIILIPLDRNRSDGVTTSNCNYFAAPASRLQHWFDG